MSLKLAGILFALSLVMVVIAPLFGLGGKYYIGDWIALIGFVSMMAMICVIALGHIMPGLRRWLKGNR